MPTPSRAGHHFADHWLKPAVPGVDDGFRRWRRMEIDRQLEPLCPRQHRPEETVVEIAAAMVAVDDDPFEPMLADHALELRESGRRIADRQRRQAEEPRRMAADRFRERGGRLAREGLCLLDLQLFDARRG